MLYYATYVTVNVIFIHFDIHSFDITHIRHFCLAPEGIEKSISGPRAKKVVHHCFILYNFCIFFWMCAIPWINAEQSFHEEVNLTFQQL